MDAVRNKSVTVPLDHYSDFYRQWFRVINLLGIHYNFRIK